MNSTIVDNFSEPFDVTSFTERVTTPSMSTLAPNAKYAYNDTAIQTMNGIISAAYNIGFPLIFLIGIPGNCLAFIITVKNKPATSTSSYIGALSVADNLVLLLVLTNWTSGKFGYTVRDISDVLCATLQFLFYFALHSAVSILMAMTAERFVLVTFPLKAKKLCTRRRSMIIIGVTVLFIFAVDGHNLFTRRLMVTSVTKGEALCLSTRYVDENSPHGYFFKKVWPWIDASMYSFIPLTTILILNILIIVQLRRDNKARSTMCQQDHTKDDIQQKQLTRTLLTVSFAFIILTSPIAFQVLLARVWNLLTTHFRM